MQAFYLPQQDLAPYYNLEIKEDKVLIILLFPFHHLEYQIAFLTFFRAIAHCFTRPTVIFCFPEPAKKSKNITASLRGKNTLGFFIYINTL